MDPLTMNLMGKAAGADSESYYVAEYPSFQAYGTRGKVDDDGNLYILHSNAFPYTGYGE